jgi:CubicO group peptidase (beta-lactamase class C family)
MSREPETNIMNTKRPPTFVSIAARAIVIASLVAGAAQVPAKTREAEASARDLKRLPDFVDGVMAHAIATREIAGAVVSVVAGGRVIFTKGYGWENFDGRVPVDPRVTLFHPGSVSKLFTWTALMQQVEAGRVGLDDDVNTHIDFVIPPFKGQPIRVRDLLSHSPGMSDVSDVITYDPAKVTSYEQWLKTHLPKRLWAPGTEVAYSNYGAALAGYIIERVSGERFPDYVERHIFAPLKMNSSSFRDPLPDALRVHLAKGYKVVGGRFVAKPPELLASIMPAGSLSSTGVDMAQFMLAVLNGGRLGNAVILKPESLQLLESDSLSNAPNLPGMAHGYLVYRRTGPRLVGHAGNTIDFHSDLVVSPAGGIGYYVSVSGGPGSYAARTEISRELTGWLFPQSPAARWQGEEEPVLSGSYRANRRDYNRDPEPAHDVSVEKAGPRRLTLKVEGVTTAWEQVGPSRYELITGTDRRGPFDQIEFSGPPGDRKLSFGSEPYETFHYVPR